jgi:hypothetical protein
MAKWSASVSSESREPKAESCERSELIWCLGWGSVVMVATLLPYLVVMGWAPPENTFSGFMWNPDDHCVYMAWMQQAARGHFFMRNLFTGDAQRGLNTNLFFWLLGSISGALRLPAPAVYHAARFVFGLSTLALAYRLGAFFTADVSVRRLGFWLTAVSAGFGWLPFFWNQSVGGPVDVWQPEAITFACLYTNGLFCIGLTLMLGVICLLLLAEQTRQARFAVAAGLVGLLLANIHGYDVITLGAVWTAYLIAKGVAGRRVPLPELGMAAFAALIALPAIGYELYLYTNEPVFQKRVAVATSSPALWKYFLGYGLLIPLAALGSFWFLAPGSWREKNGSLPSQEPGSRRQEPEHSDYWLLPVWAVVGFAVPYLPVSFQRKMVMGLHVPLALLAAQGCALLAGVLRRWCWRDRAIGAVLTGLVVLTSLSNVRYPIRDLGHAMVNQASTGIHPVFWPDTEYAAMRWLGRATDERSVVLSSTITGCMIPAVAGRAVYAGHWGETPDFTGRFNEVWAFFRWDWPSSTRAAFLRARGITHVYLGVMERNLRRLPDPRAPNAPLPPPLDLSREPYLQRVYPPPAPPRSGGLPKPGPDAVIVYAVR